MQCFLSTLSVIAKINVGELLPAHSMAGGGLCSALDLTKTNPCRCK